MVDSNQNINLDEGIKHFPGLEDLLTSEINIDAAIIATPTNTHYEITKKLLNNGIHVLVEKPLSTKAEEASELINLADEKNLVLLVDHTFLYNEAINFAIKSIQDGEIGSLLHINFERTNLGPIRSDVSCLWDLTTHDVSILNAITPDEPRQIRASSFNTSHTESFDMVNVSLNYENNLFVTMFSSWLHPEKTRKIKIVGDKKMIVFDDLNFNEPIKIYDKKFDQIYDKEISQNNNNSFSLFLLEMLFHHLSKTLNHFNRLLNISCRQSKMIKRSFQTTTMKLL